GRGGGEGVGGSGGAVGHGTRRRGIRRQRAQRTASARGRFEQREVQSAHRSAAFGALQFRIRHRQQIALQLDIEVVLDRQRQRILQREIQVAGANQIVNTRRVIVIDRRRG